MTFIVITEIRLQGGMEFAVRRGRILGIDLRFSYEKSVAADHFNIVFEDNYPD